MTIFTRAFRAFCTKSTQHGQSRFTIFLQLVSFLLFILATPQALAKDDDTDFTFSGDVKNVCAVMQYSTKAVILNKDFQAARKQEQEQEEERLRVWADLIAEAEIRSGVSIDDVDPIELSVLMADVEKEAEKETESADENEESWTAFDISRTALSAASLADPTGITGVAAAYTYPKCGSEEALKGVGGFCWKDSYGRGFGSLPASFGRVADCPEGYTNNGLFCGKGASTYSAPSRLATCPTGYKNTGVSCLKPASTYKATSRLADCPEGFTNTGVSCFKGADTYHAPSRLADCPKDFKNTGISCYRVWPPKSMSLSSATCPRGYFKGLAGRCYKNCRKGYTNNGEFCGRGAESKSLASATCPGGYFKGLAGRCYEECRAGYTNNGEFCGRGADSKSLAAATCPAGYFKGALNRCYEVCKEGYTNNGEFCGRGASTKGLSSMTCKSSEFFMTGRCYDKATTCGADEELDAIGLCYPECKEGFHGVGPVCWSSCEGKLGVACAAGCATSGAECGLATTDMVASPIESVLSIATLSGYSAAKSARKASTIAARKAAQSALVKGGKKLIKTGVRKLDDLLEAASRATGTAQVKAAAGPMTKAFVKNAKARAVKAGKKAKKLRAEAPVVLKNFVTKLFAPVADKSKLAAEMGWEYTKKGWVKIKGFVRKDQPKPPLPGWEIDPNGFPGLLDFAITLPPEAAQAVTRRSKELYKKLSQQRKLVGEEESVQALRLVRKCTTAGFTIDQAALR